MSQRAFGVEIECYAPNNLWEHDCGCDYCNGPDYYNEYGGAVEATANILEEEFSDWYVDEDSSLRQGGVEIKSPVLQGADGFKSLKAMFKFLNEQGFDVDGTCGLHIHHDALEFAQNFDLQRLLVESWMQNQKLINNMVAPSRIRNGNCPEWTSEWFDRFVNSGSVYDTPRGTINLQNLGDYTNTIEIRQHEGTLNYDEAESWIKFGQNFIDSVSGNNAPTEPLDDEELLLRKLKMTKKASEVITNKVKLNKERGNR